jgi:hypothetical protein
MPDCEVDHCTQPATSNIYTAAGSQHALCSAHAELWEGGYRQRRAQLHGSPDDDRDFARFILQAGAFRAPGT